MHGFATHRIAIAVIACAIARAAARADGCPDVGAEPAHLATLGPRLELRLADGRLLRLAGVEAAADTPTTPDRAAAAGDALAALIKDRALTVTILAPKPDRWGRLIGFASVADGPAAGRAGGLAAAALAAGLGRFRPEPAAAACRAALLSAEDSARRARLGLWADPYYSVLAVNDGSSFAGRAGTDVVVEARLAAVEAGPYRTRLRFAASDTAASGARTQGRNLEATVLPRVMKTFEAHGVDFTSLIGRTLRLRGLLDRRFGPQIELAGPDDVEVLPEPTLIRPN